MEFGICLLPVVPLRKEPSDRSEMLTQVLFGETVRIYERSHKWISVESDLDDYPGWVDVQQIEVLEEAEYHRIKELPITLSSDLFSEINEEVTGKMVLTLGSCLPGIDSRGLSVGGHRFLFSGNVVPFARHNEDDVIRTALKYLNAPYLWGGRTILGIDCSGFTQAIFRLNGVNIPRDARQQASVGEPISLLTEARPGDLAFFDNSEGTIVHVGLVKDSQHIIHASGKVRIDLLDHQGIYNSETKSYTHRLRLIRRVTG